MITVNAAFQSRSPQVLGLNVNILERTTPYMFLDNTAIGQPPLFLQELRRFLHILFCRFVVPASVIDLYDLPFRPEELARAEDGAPLQNR